MERIKGIKCALVLTDEQKELVNEFIKRQNKLNLYASKQLRKLIKKNIQVDVKVKPEPIYDNIKLAIRYLPDQILLSASSRWLKRHTDIESLKKELALPYSDNVRCASYLSARFYKGIQRRFKHLKKGEFYIPKNPAIPKVSKALYMQGNMMKKVFTKYSNGVTNISFVDNNHASDLVDVDGLQIQLNLHNKISFNVPIRVPKRQAHLLNFIKYDKKKLYCDTNLMHSKKGFDIVLKITESFDFSYQPKTVIGIDMNRRQECFITLSNEFGKIALNDSQANLVEKVKEANTAISSYNGRKRTKRLQWFAARTKLQNSFDQQVNNIIQLAKDNEALIAVDGIALAESGTFGHSEFLKSLISRLSNENIPYVKVETPNTSKDCYHCLITTNEYKVVARHNNFADIICPNCMRKFDADVNAANNIAHDGWQIFLTGKNPRKSTRNVKRNPPKYNKVLKQYNLVHNILF